MRKKSKKVPINKIFLGDCKEKLSQIPDRSVNLVITSPPYADNRKSSYKGVSMDEYVDWFLPISYEIKRVLKNNGSFILNIKERASNGERHTFVLQLILAMKEQGWVWVEEYIWHKKNSYPGKWPNRFRDSWERCLHFTKKKKFNMYQEAVMVPMGKWAEKRLSKLSNKDKMRYESRVNSGFGKNISNWIGRDKAYPTNVLQLSTESSNKGHSATFPIALPDWFIKLFTEENDLILDPFAGSGTTIWTSLKLGRKAIGIDNKKEYFDLMLYKMRDINAS